VLKSTKTPRNDTRTWRCLSKQTNYSTKHENRSTLVLWAFNQHQEWDFIMSVRWCKDDFFSWKIWMLHWFQIIQIQNN